MTILGLNQLPRPKASKLNDITRCCCACLATTKRLLWAPASPLAFVSAPEPFLPRRAFPGASDLRA